MSASPAEKCIQEQYAPHNACFGCGPANEKGLRIRSFPSPAGDGVVATWTPEKHHEAFPGVLNGGIIGSLLDCHCNWAAAYHLMKVRGAASPPCTVTADYSIALKRPCPTDGPVTLTAKVVEQTGDKCVVEGVLEAQGKVRGTCRGTFVAVTEGHPAYHRW
jgi:acyl-coenzyme A thioesterase PaaI-like protein